LSHNLSHRKSDRKLAVTSNAMTSPLVKCHSVYFKEISGISSQFKLFS